MGLAYQCIKKYRQIEGEHDEKQFRACRVLGFVFGSRGRRGCQGLRHGLSFLGCFDILALALVFDTHGYRGLLSHSFGTRIRGGRIDCHRKTGESPSTPIDGTLGMLRTKFDLINESYETDERSVARSTSI